MKKLFRLTAVFLLILTLAACSSPVPPVSSGQITPAPPGSSGPSEPVAPPSAEVPPQPENPVPPPAEPLHIPELTIELPRIPDASAARKAMLSLPERMAEHQVIIDSVSLSFGPTYSATAAAVQQGGVQLAFLPAVEYLMMESGSLLLADAYPDAEGTLTPGISVLVCAGPSAYGTKLAELAESRGTPLSWSELDRARWGVLAEDSIAGHLCLRLWLEDNYEDNAVTDLSHVTVYDSWDALLQAAAAEEIDLFPLPPALVQEADTRWTTDFSGKAPFAQSVQTVGASKGVCTWVAVAAPEDDAVNDSRFSAALSAVINGLFADPTAQQAAIGARYYTAARENTLDPLRRLLLGGL